MVLNFSSFNQYVVERIDFEVMGVEELRKLGEISVYLELSTSLILHSLCWSDIKGKFLTLEPSVLFTSWVRHRYDLS